MARNDIEKVKNPVTGSIMPDGVTISESEKTCDGVVKVHESVVASIVRKATCSVDGVVRLAGSSIVDNIAEIVGSKKMYDRAIAIDMGPTSVKIEVKAIFAYGVHIPTVAAAVQAAVIEEMNRITGMNVEKINVMVMDLEDGQPENE